MIEFIKSRIVYMLTVVFNLTLGDYLLLIFIFSVIVLYIKHRRIDTKWQEKQL